MRIGSEVSLGIIGQLTMRQQIGPAEHDLAREKPSVIALPNYLDLVIRLFHVVPLGIAHNFVSILDYGNFIFGIDFPEQEGVINMLRA